MSEQPNDTIDERPEGEQVGDISSGHGNPDHDAVSDQRAAELIANEKRKLAEGLDPSDASDVARDRAAGGGAGGGGGGSW